MIGKVVDGTFNVKVGDKTLDTPAIVIEGTSYLPVRAFGDATGYDVGFDSNLGITMTPKMYTPAPQTPKETLPIKGPITVSMFGNTSSIDGYLEKDGNQYIPIRGVIGADYSVKYVSPNVIVKEKDKPDIAINVNNQYQENIDGFTYNGTIFIKLSALGLKATVNGDTLTIDKQ
jgi:hypothetical protein